MNQPAQSVYRSLMLFAAVIAALLLVACGDDEGGGGSDGGPSPATVTPAGAPLYFEAVVRPEGEQKDGLDSALQKLTGEEDPSGVITEQLDQSLSEQGFSYAEDVEPWLGRQAGLFLIDFAGSTGSDAAGAAANVDGNGAVAVAVTDQDAAREAVRRAADADDLTETDETYQGVDYLLDSEGNAIGIVGDFLVAGPQESFEAAVDASSGDSLADDTQATDAIDGAPQDSLFRSYIDVGALVDLAVDSGQVSEKDLEGAGAQLDQLRGGPVVISGQASSDSLAIEATGPAGEGTQSTEIVSTLPANAWLALGVPMVGESVSMGFQSFLDGLQSGVESGALPPGASVPDVAGELESAIGLDLSKDLAWAGDMAVYAAGSSPFELGAGIVIDTDDEAAASRAVEKIRKSLASRRGIQVAKTADGFQISGLAGAPVGAEVAVTKGKMLVAIAGVTIDDLLNPAETLDQSANFSEAAGALDGLAPALYFDFPTILALLESTGQTGNPDFQQVQPVLDALNYLIAGSGEESDLAIARIVLGLKEPSSSSGAAAAITP